jgi:exonuclease SbcD
MKILHTSDWHLGKKLEGFSRLDEQKEVLEEICQIADQEAIQAVIIAGDLFDNYNPPAEAVEIFYKYLKKLAGNGKRAVIAIAGNHDSPERIEAPDPLARECGIIFAGNPDATITPFRLETGLELVKSDKGFLEIALPGAAQPLRLLITPYANELRLKSYLGSEEAEGELRKLLEHHWHSLASAYCDDKGVNMLVAHLLFATDSESVPEEPEEERSINFIGGAQAIFTENLPEGVRYVALGHLHRRQVVSKIPCPVVYSGSPLAYSFSEANQDKFVMIIEAEPGEKVKTREVKLTSGKRLLRKRFESIDLAVAWLVENQGVYVELTIVSDQYLAAIDRKRLLDAHEGIVNIVPESRGMGMEEKDGASSIDLSKGMEALFVDFYKHKKGQEPDSSILELFREVISTEEGS